jgi:hypothetical protein
MLARNFVKRDAIVCRMLRVLLTRDWLLAQPKDSKTSSGMMYNPKLVYPSLP